MLMAPLFLVAKGEKQPKHPSADERTNCGIHVQRNTTQS